MRVFTPPTVIKGRDLSKSVFLAGSIEMGKATDWQSDVIDSLKFIDHNFVILNPRRNDWDSSWKQEIKNDQFRNQVQWEMYGLEHCTLIALYLAPGTISPISLLELGLYAKSNKIIVCCPDEFHRRGNVEIVCSHFNIPFTNNYIDFKGKIIEKIKYLY